MIPFILFLWTSLCSADEMPVPVDRSVVSYKQDETVLISPVIELSEISTMTTMPVVEPVIVEPSDTTTVNKVMSDD